MTLRTARTTASAALAAAAACALALTACSGGASGGASGGETETVTLKVAAHTEPMTDIVLAAGEAIEDGYEIELVEVADYVQPNQMLQAGELDANFVQHLPFMEEFNEKNDASLVRVQPVYKTVVGFYSKTVDSLDELPDGGSVVIPQDVSNAGRALRLLSDEGVIELDDSAEQYGATLDDITDNPRDLAFTQVELLSLNSAYEEADAVFNLPAFARQIGLTPQDDAIATEGDERFAVSLVTREEDEDSPETEALKRAFTSDEVREAVEESGNPLAF
ncbi:D-methionine-binding lipoprotein MetQ [Leucobacter sp. CSA1]|uniref:D-methionine-binding lipoprotein MetQ n=1 Tax=Leucobacter chromiisoli TaxID=2796471 RepID=A0A934UTZ8_9MICO|nr:MetQ/NlpA family ABC transporter substrate-binding protein [Leucobacter chromiisoli]MBK0417452.1 D-methionine-binding lipoprotein MetQ [Leucobacter chromiisoli]